MPPREPVLAKPKGRFLRISAAGIFFQGGTAAIDTTTIIAALVHGLTGSVWAVGAAAAIGRYGWLFPQLFVAYFAQKRVRRMGFYMAGAFGRAACLVALAVLLLAAGNQGGVSVTMFFFGLWILYSFVSGIVAVPYNDIVARSIPSQRRSRLLAIRFFGGGLLALLIAAAAHRILATMPFPSGYAVVIMLGAAMLFLSAISFVSAGESPAPRTAHRPGFGPFLSRGIEVVKTDRRFRLFLYSQWLGGAVVMALPFYVLAAVPEPSAGAGIAVLLAAQTIGALGSNLLWGWWGDRLGKRSLLEGVALLRILPPLLTIALGGWFGNAMVPSYGGFLGVFFLLGALTNGGTIAMLGYLMEISPNDQRPAYSGYFNALVAPAALLPLLGAGIIEIVGLDAVFVVSLSAAILQYLVVRALRGPRLAVRPS